MALTDTACRAARGRQTDYKLSDGGGLYLLVKPGGSAMESGVPVRGYDGRPTLRCALQFTALTFARPGEIRAALRRMGFTQDEMTAHGFRAAASSILNERGFRPDVIEAALGHQDQTEIRRAYNRASYWPERIELMQAWADCIDQFKQPP